MNQILQVHGNRNNSSIDIKKVALFFAIAITIFGLVMIGEGVYYLYKQKINEKVNNKPQSNNGEENTNAPIITLTQLENNTLKINIDSEVTISHIIYNWNNEVSKTIEENGKTTIEEIINIPSGENTFNISVIDSNGNETKKQENFIIEIVKPTIEVFIVGTDIKIIVTSEAELSYVTYKWNSEELVTEDMYTYENKKKFEKTIAIPKGQNTLQIEAVDINGSTSEKSQEIKGVTKAKTNVTVQGQYLEFSIIGEDNIKTVEFVFNGKKYLMNSDTFGQTNTVHYKVKMIEGMNYLKIISTTENDAIDTSTWKHEYKIS